MSATTFTVNSTGDPGDGVCDATECTLREAIDAADANPGTDTIAFNIPGTGPHTISPGSALPTITDPVIIDGTSEPDFGDAPIIELNGSSAGAAVDGLTITAGSSTVKGLVINRFDGDAIELSGNGANTIEGNYIGTDVNGTQALPNHRGVHVVAGAQNNTIGGTTSGERNVISAHGNIGVYIRDSGTQGNVVKGNYIGTNAAGTACFAQLQGYGVRIEHGAQNNTIGGSTSGERNVISCNDQAVSISGTGTEGNVVKGNYIGLSAEGGQTLNNWNNWGIIVHNGAQHNTIGGTSAGEGNFISGNDWAGVHINGSGTNSNAVLGNWIGINPDGDPLGNHYGVLIDNGAHNNAIGGTLSGWGNVIALNRVYGVWVDGATTTGNAISGNSIHSNGLKGIENSEGGNTELAPPTVDSVGSVFGTACPNCTIDIYSDEDDQGEVYEGSTTANADGNWSFSGLPLGPNVTATATDSGGNTSEFSEPLTPPWPTPTATPAPAVGGMVEIQVDGSGSAVDSAADSSEGSALDYYMALAAAVAAVIALTAGVWYARRRWLR